MHRGALRSKQIETKFCARDAHKKQAFALHRNIQMKPTVVLRGIANRPARDAFDGNAIRIMASENIRRTLLRSDDLVTL